MTSTIPRKPPMSRHSLDEDESAPIETVAGPVPAPTSFTNAAAIAGKVISVSEEVVATVTAPAATGLVGGAAVAAEEGLLEGLEQKIPSQQTQHQKPREMCSSPIMSPLAPPRTFRKTQHQQSPKEIQSPISLDEVEKMLCDYEVGFYSRRLVLFPSIHNAITKILFVPKGWILLTPR